jgi:hypothetical protein
VPDGAGHDGEEVVADGAGDVQRLADADQGRVIEDGDGECLLEEVPGVVSSADVDAVGGPGGEVEGIGGRQLAAGDGEGGVVGRPRAANQRIGVGVNAAELEGEESAHRGARGPELGHRSRRQDQSDGPGHRGLEGADVGRGEDGGPADAALVGAEVNGGAALVGGR